MSKFLKVILEILLIIGLVLLIVLLLPQAFPWRDGSVIIRFISIVSILVIAVGIFFALGENEHGTKFRRWLRNNKWLKSGLGYLVLWLLIIAAGTPVAVFMWRATQGVQIEQNSFLTLLAIFITAIVSAGIAVYSAISKKIKRQVKNLVDEEHNLVYSRANFLAGYILWFLYYNGDDDFDQKGGFLKEAITFAKYSVDFASKLDTQNNKEIICNCKNNLAFFLAYRGDLADEEKAWELAQDIDRAAKKNWIDFNIPYSYEAVLALVDFRYGDEIAKNKSYEIIRNLLNNPDVPKDWRKELEKLWRSKKMLGNEQFEKLLLGSRHNNF